MSQGEQISRRSVVSGASVGVATLVLPRAAMAASEGSEAAFFAASAGNLGTFTGLVATDTTQGGSVSLDWSGFSATGATGAVLYQAQFRLQEEGSQWVTAGTTDQKTFVVTGLTNATPYFFQVIASDGTRSSTSSEAAATPTLAAPGVPQNLAVVPGESQQLLVSWDAPASGGPVATYTVEYRTGGGAYSTQTVSSPTKSLTLTGLTNDSTYDVRVYATNATTSSSATAVVSATPSVPLNPAYDPPAPEPPVTAVRTTHDSVILVTDKSTHSSQAYEYSTDGSSWTPMSDFSGDEFTVAASGWTGTTSLFVRRLNGDTPTGRSRVDITKVSTSYAPGVAYTWTNALGSTRVQSLRVAALGGAGAVGGNDGTANLGGQPGRAGYVVADIEVGSGELLRFAAGSTGTAGKNGAVSGDAAPAGGVNALYSGVNTYRGGVGGRTGPKGSSGQGGAGGAASIVRRSIGGTESIVLVAGGAGGGGGATNENPNGLSKNGGAGSDSAGGYANADGNGSPGTTVTGSNDNDAGGGGGGGGGYQQGGSGGNLTGLGTKESGTVFNRTYTHYYRGNGGNRGSNLVSTNTTAGSQVTEVANGVGDGASGRPSIPVTTAGYVQFAYLSVTAVAALDPS